MKLHEALGWMLAFLVVAAPDAARAQSVTFSFRFDENGHGSLDTGGGFVPVGGVLRADPTGSVAVPVLTYFLPGLVTSGDVLVLEFAEAPDLSDVVRFTNASGGLDGGSMPTASFFTRICPSLAR